MMNKEHNVPKKAPKRFTYPVDAFVELNGTRQIIQIQNISKTGIQFYSNVSIANYAQIRMMWQDSQLGAMESLVLVVRSLQPLEESKFQYGYGSKFVNLKEEVRKNVNRLVEITEEHERKSFESMVGHMPFKTINDVITHGRAFLRDTLRGNKSAAVVDKIAKELKGYEKKCFDTNDEAGQWLQKIVTQYFHSRILVVVLASPIKLSEIQKLIMDKIQSMDCLITECKRFIEANAVEKKSPLYESMNRLVFARLELAEAFNKRIITPVSSRS